MFERCFQFRFVYISNAIIGLNVVFNLDLFIFFRLGLYHIFPPVYMIRSSDFDSNIQESILN